jgi:cytochrome c biogenesis protein CcdA
VNEMHGNQAAARLRLAMLSSTTGAGVLGLGLGALAARYVAGVAVPIVIAGMLLHSWGMIDKHRIETRQAVVNRSWERWLYGICWLLLAGLIVLGIWRVL